VNSSVARSRSADSRSAFGICCRFLGTNPLYVNWHGS
jgi:hypothetical protein